MSEKAPQATWSADIGILLCGAFREALRTAKFKYGGLDFMEGDGWFQRTFTVKGDADIVGQLERHFKERFESNDGEEEE